MDAACAQGAIPPGNAAGSPPTSGARVNETALDEITVTSTKTEGRAIDALAGASVLGSEQIQQVQPSRISESLQQVPGVTSQEARNDPGQSINIRGLQDFGRVNVLIDGARQNFQVSGHGAQGTFYLDPDLIGGVDITRGPVSTIYGSGAIGGVVSFRTKGIDDILLPAEQAGVVQKFGGGSNGYGFLNSTAGGFRLPDNAATVFGQFVVRNNFVYRDGAGFLIPDTGSELRAGNFKVTVNPADGHQITATALVQRFSFTNFPSQILANGSAPVGIANGAGALSPPARFANDVYTDTYTLGYRWTPPDIPLIDLSLKGYHSTTSQDSTYLGGSATYNALGAVAGIGRARVDLETNGFDVFNTSRFDTGPIRHAVTFGGDGAFDNVRTTDTAGGYISAFTPTGRRDLTGAFVQDEMRFGGWLRAIGAVRYDSYSLAGGAFRSSGDHVSPRGTVGVSPFPWIEFFGTYAEGYRAPSISETLIAGVHPFPAFTILPNPALRPEIAHNVEGGVNIKFDSVFRDGDAVRAKVVGFSNSVDNYIGIQGVGPTFYLATITGAFANAFCAGRTVPFAFCQIPAKNQQYLNITRADLSGAEVEAAYDWVDGFASLAYSHVDGVDGNTKAQLLTIPPDRVAATLGFRFLDQRLTVGARLVYADARSFTPATTAQFCAGSADPQRCGFIIATKSYGIVDLFASYKYNEWVQGDLTLANVGDVRYRRYLDFERSPGFQARGSLTVKFATR